MKNTVTSFKAAILMMSTAALLGGCKVGVDGAQFADLTSSSTAGGGTGSGANPTNNSADYVAGIGGTLSGSGATSVATGAGLMQRIYNGLNGRASATRLNFRAASEQLGGNLSNSTDPTQLNGADGNMLLAYAACTDTDSRSYGLLSTNPSVAANKTALIAFGVKIIDNYTAGLGSNGSTSAQLQAALGAIVDQSIANGATVEQAYITTCTAAVTAGSTMFGF